MDLALSDDGSAAWIGHHAMRASLRALQGVEPSALGEALLHHFQLPADIEEPWRALREVRLAISKADLAALTERIVVPLSEYDDVARALLMRAGDALAADILAAARAIEAPSKLEVLAVGGVWASDLIRAQATQHVIAKHPDATLKRVDAATGAARLAQQLLDPS
jgi:N-acetylglucosamine kinase-like BadF-type ATPase